MPLTKCFQYYIHIFLVTNWFLGLVAIASNKLKNELPDKGKK